MRRVVSIICLIVGICLSGMAPASDEARFYEEIRRKAYGEKCDSEVGVFEDGGYHAEARRHRRALNQIGILRIGRSSDPWLLFGEFAKRLSVIAVDRSPEAWPPRDVRSIIKTGGGDRHELAFVLLTLFAANDFETELVHIYRDQNLFSEAIDRVLVHLPVLDLVFDPTLPAADQHKGPGRTLLDGETRVHRAYPVWRWAYNCPGSPIRGYLGKRSPNAGP